MCRWRGRPTARLAAIDLLWLIAALIGAFVTVTTVSLAQGAMPGGKADATPTAVVEHFIAAVNRGDGAAVLAFFPDDGVVDDWGRRNVGRNAIKSWSDKEFVGAKGRMAAVHRCQGQRGYSRGRMEEQLLFRLQPIHIIDGDQIREMRIPRH